MDNIQITFQYKDYVYEFDFGYQAYIFHTGIYNQIDEKYGLTGLERYTSLVEECYLKDSNRTPLGFLADYIAETWETVADLDCYEILNKFYLEEY